MHVLRYVSLFLRIAELGSLSAAGRSLGLPHSSVSRQLTQLEAELGARLVHRSTRSFSLTEAGHAVRREFLRIADAHAALEAALHPDAPTGTLRVTLSHAFALSMVMPTLPEFCRRYPGLSVSLYASNRWEELAGQGFDVAIRNGGTRDSSLVGRKLGTTPFVVVASPAYLATNGTPDTIEALSRHKVVAFHPVQEQPHRWTMANGVQRATIAFTPAFVANDLQLALSAAELGMGLACLPRRLCRDALQADRLVHVLPGWEQGHVSTYAMYTSRRELSPKIRVFLDHLARTMEF